MSITDYLSKKTSNIVNKFIIQITMNEIREWEKTVLCTQILNWDYRNVTGNTDVCFGKRRILGCVPMKALFVLLTCLSNLTHVAFKKFITDPEFQAWWKELLWQQGLDKIQTQNGIRFNWLPCRKSFWLSSLIYRATVRTLLGVDQPWVY